MMRFLLSLVGILLSATTIADEPDLEYSVVAPLAEKSLLLDAERISDRIVVVGERGHLLLSEDNGGSWRQLRVPTRATLNAVAFAGDLGYAVGHDAVVLRSRDAGDTWERVFYDPEQERPLLDVMIVGDRRAIAVGAYGFYIETDDQGDSWSERILKTGDWGAPPPATAKEGDEEPSDDFHLNRIVAAETGKWFMAAEAGTIYRSDDQGGAWHRLPSPYEGSFFDVLPLSDDALLLAGLQGKLFHSRDAGENWTQIESGTAAILFAATRLGGGGVAVVGYSGTVLIGEPDSGGFVLYQQSNRAAISSVIELDNGELLLVGEGGASRLSPRQSATEPR